ncbi:hypothetical protein N0V93_005056 [Gnomoniopsis smithogilvyi]|uniref:Cycloeucalenol cycloisomerase n=1 Tax=Gnomoniopsis smithogilvyi TaxID=1191159 RepID=A0A9W8YVY8_9PEZI|nr:hypothetical protein N0V93_005056 [Gnomoniopsis smithogilvyi]
MGSGLDASPTRARLNRAKPYPPSAIATEKRLTETAILAQAPLWILPVAWVMLTDRLAIWDDTYLLNFCILVAAPSVFVPAIALPRSAQKWPYWLKLHVWVGIIVFFGTYLGTHYFFDFMGMRYTFGEGHATFDSTLGRSGQHVPLFMYPLTHAYFMTYYAVLMWTERKLLENLPYCLSKSVMARASITFILSYALAFLETLAMAVDAMAPYFAYENRCRMMMLGSWGYASYFVVGLPMVRRIDEDGEWDMGRVVLQAAGSCMGILALLEMWTHIVGPL